MAQETIFSKIVRKEIPADIVYEDEEILAFRDIRPKAPVHLLVIPKTPFESLEEVGDSRTRLLGRLFEVAREVAAAEGVDQSGYRLVLNNGPDSGQEVPHVHLHVLGGRKMTWPPG